jgi:hypothetical protein
MEWNTHTIGFKRFRFQGIAVGFRHLNSSPVLLFSAIAFYPPVEEGWFGFVVACENDERSPSKKPTKPTTG